jgi:hypothetical protein
MNTKEIEILIEKYFEGLTSIEEERLLKDFFASGDFPEEMKPVAAMFGYFEVEKEVKLSPDFSDEFIRQINEKRKIPFYRHRKFWYYFSGVAASIIFLISFFYENQNSPIKTKYTNEEAQLAYLQTKETLAFVSGKFNAGVKPLHQIEKITENADRISQISKFNQSINKVNNNVEKMQTGVDNIRKLSKFNIIIEQ